jgi:LPXTG-motif cell wall-anchored protein
MAGTPRRIGGRPRTAQKGQVLVMALGLMLLGAAGLYLMFSAGQLLTAKHRLVNAADASAWSAGVWRARVLKYHA